MAQEPNTLSAPTIDGIRSQIAETRAEMRRTIAAIQARLSPRRLMADAKHTLRDATVGRVMRLAKTSSSKAADLMRQSFEVSGCAVDWAKGNPVPMAVAGAGAAGLIARALWKIKKS